MSQRQHLDELIEKLPQLKQYTWSFRIKGEFAKISCVSTSIDLAREQIIDLINKIDDGFRDFRKMTFETEEEEKEFLKKMPTKEDFDAIINVSIYAVEFCFWTCDMTVSDLNNKVYSIKEFIETKIPYTCDFKLIQII